MYKEVWPDPATELLAGTAKQRARGRRIDPSSPSPVLGRRPLEVEMLVLARKNGQSLILTLPDQSKIQVMIVSGGAKVGIQAPHDVQVTRMDDERVLRGDELIPRDETKER